MAKKGSDWTNIDRRLEGEPIQVGETTVRAVGRLTGKSFQGGNAQAGGAGAAVTLRAEELIVQEPGGERRISLAPDPDPSLRGLFLAGGAMAAACIAVMFLSRPIIRRVFG